MKLSDLNQPLKESFSLGALISKLGSALGQTLHLIPGVEHFKNSGGTGFGQRYVEGSSLRCIRLNWSSDSAVGNANKIESIDLFTGNSKDPSFNISTKGVSIEGALTAIMNMIKSPKIGTEKIMATESAGETEGGEVIVTKGASSETYLPSAEEKEIEKDAGSVVPYAEALEHLEGLVDAVIAGASNALFIAGRGGCLARDTEIDVIVPLDDSRKDRLSEMLGFDLDEDDISIAQTIEIQAIEEAAQVFHNIDELELNKMYPFDGVFIPTPDGFRDIKGIIRKKGQAASVLFENDETIDCLVNHLFIDEVGMIVQAQDLYVGQKISSVDGPLEVIDVMILDDEIEALDISMDTHEGVYYTANGILHHNTGKTQTVETVLAANGLTDGNGYYANSGSASASGIYSLLYHHRNEIILFDDSDGALKDQDARNLIKAATDTKKVRKLSWTKNSSFIFDPEVEDEEAFQGDLSMAPNKFEFTGKVIFISNLSLDKLDPDGALRTRALVINIDPTDEEMFQHMATILYDIKLANGVELSEKDRDHVLNIVKTSSRKGEVSLRKLVRALNFAASGVANWEKLVKLYC